VQNTVAGKQSVNELDWLVVALFGNSADPLLQAALCDVLARMDLQILYNWTPDTAAN
jgi:hypothetical protein